MSLPKTVVTLENIGEKTIEVQKRDTSSFNRSTFRIHYIFTMTE